MLFRRRLHAVATMIVVAAVGVTPAHATSEGTLTVRGAAGSTVDVTFSRRVLFPVVGSTVSFASDGGWSAVALVSTAGRASDRHVFVHATLPQTWRCPGGTCPWTALGPPDMADTNTDGQLVLPAGRYHVVLAGPAGTEVTATLRSSSFRGSVAKSTRSRALNFASSSQEGQTVNGRDVLLHAYNQIPAGGTFGLAISFQTYAVDTAALMDEADCVTAGSNTQVTQTIGGVAPCYDAQGEDYYTRPVPAVVTPTPINGSYAPVSASILALYGASDSSLGLGTDFAVTAPTKSYVRRLFLAFETN